MASLSGFDSQELLAELERVCPEAVNGLATDRPPPEGLTPERALAVIRSLPDGAGVDAFLRALYAAPWATERPGEDAPGA